MELHEIFDIGGIFESVIDWLTENLDVVFDVIADVIDALLTGLFNLLMLPHAFVLIALFTALAWWVAKKGVAIFTVLGFFLIYAMNLWEATMETLALVITSVIIAIVISIPIGIWAAKKDTVEAIVRPILDFMQTLPAFVYLIPAVLFFRLGAVPGVVATLIFSMPPAVRLTNLGIRQVPREIKEASVSFGATGKQILFKAELPVAIPTIMAGVNQTIMLALSMVVISGMIGAGGLGNEVLKGITQLKIDLGFESGIAIVILAIFLDRITQALGVASQKQN
jgi:glycine betaine/proline transport system permease protein